MKYFHAVTWIKKIKNFQDDLKGIDIEKADKKRIGAYSVALVQLKDLLDGKTNMEDVFLNPDNTLRNIMLLSHLDKIDSSTKK